MGEPYNVHTCRIHECSSFVFFLFCLQNQVSPPSNKIDHSNPDVENPSFSFLFFFSSFPFTLFSFSRLPFPWFFLVFILLNPSQPTPFSTPSVPSTPPISLGLPQLHKHSSIHEVSSWLHLLLCLTTKDPSGLKMGCKQPIKWPKTGPNSCIGLI